MIDGYISMSGARSSRRPSRLVIDGMENSMRHVLPVLVMGVVVASTSVCLADGAVAIGDGRYAISYNQRNGRAADERAIEACEGRDCRVVLRFAGGCAAFANDGHGHSGWAKGEREHHAEHKAVEECRGHSRHPDNCEVRLTRCDGG